MDAMQQEQSVPEPLYWDNHRVSVNLTMIFALAVAVLGLFSGGMLFFAGVGVAAYTWFTSPRRYLICDPVRTSQGEGNRFCQHLPFGDVEPWDRRPAASGIGQRQADHGDVQEPGNI